MRCLISQKMRQLAPEMDPLRIGTGWKPEDLSKPQIFIESTFGDSHPGSGHLDRLVEEVRAGAAEAGGHGARYFCTDICDGESQGTDGINYSLVSREIIANMIEIQAKATPFDAGVYLASCDKGMPGNLMGLMRVDIPSVVVSGGTMNAGPDMLTLEQLGMYSARYERGEIDEDALNWAKENACPQLRRLLLHRHRLHHADHGRGPGPGPAGQRPDAGHQPGPAVLRQRSRPPGRGNGGGRFHASQPHRHHGQF